MFKRDYMENINNGYAICFNEWTLDKSIKNELRLLLIVSSLCAKEGYCFATNDYLAKLFGEDECSISRKLKKLEDKNYIKITYKKNGNVVSSREIRLTKISTAVDKKINGAVDKNVKENNINISSNINITRLSNNINSNINNIVEYLNLKANVHFKPTSNKTRTLISTRLREGFTEEDFKVVIDKKCTEWLNTDMSKYLRPETLFGTKFEGYLNQTINVDKLITNSKQFEDMLERGIL